MNVTATPNEPENRDLHEDSSVTDNAPQRGVHSHRKNAASEETPSKKEKKKRKELPWYVEIPAVVVVTLAVVVLFQAFVGRLYMIPSQSMEPTLHGCEGCTGDRIFVDKLTYRFSDPKPGDVVVFKGTDAWNIAWQSSRSTNPVIHTAQDIGTMVGLVAPDENYLVKRIIATGGQTIQCQADDPGIMVDGKQIDSSYIQNPPMFPPRAGDDPQCQGPNFGPITVPEGEYYMMGDNRTGSWDSRGHDSDEHRGAIPRENIIGKVQAIVFPLSRMGLVKSYDIQAAQ